MIDLANKVVLITGAAKGIGKALSIEYSKVNAIVILSDIDETVHKVADEIKKTGKKADSYICDVTNKDKVKSMVDKIIQDHQTIDILVNNAGIFPSKAFTDLDEDLWEKTINVNLNGIYYLTKAVVPHMIYQESGKIVNIASIAGTRVGFQQLTHYSMTKAGVLGFTRALALELAHTNIQVNAIAPGAISTPGATQDNEQNEQIIQAIPMKRWGKPEEIAYASIFLSSDKANYITGELLVVDGGWTIQ